MRHATTEYRESYCWIQGSMKNKNDDFDKMISQKVSGNYKNDEDDQNQNELSKYGIDIKDCLPEKKRKPKQYIPPLPQQQMQSSTEEKQAQKSFGRRSLISNRDKIDNKRKSACSSRCSKRSGSGSDRSVFCNYGNGNTSRLNPKFNLTSYNISADDGVNPNTLTRVRGRKVASEKYGRTPKTTVRVYKPGFYESPNQAPEEIRQELAGPFWVSWPSNKPVPPQYAQLKHIVEFQ